MFLSLRKCDCERIAAFGDQDLFLEACSFLPLCKFDPERVLANAIRSENWDFVRFLAKKYGYDQTTNSLWYAVAGNHTSLLQICFDENLADVKFFFENCYSRHGKTYNFLSSLFPNEDHQILKKKKTQ